ncbi:hypothetical protein TNCT_285281 [Trichonephila clavata]|uniref:Uncharacterized protein n=1 Tax=Trichonephila clavata TaxID=2740835 RepID=A0A8X6LBR5_TRICU|nr:hypothetical protein TNCT_285281 [Trichonephila clavata]
MKIFFLKKWKTDNSGGLSNDWNGPPGAVQNESMKAVSDARHVREKLDKQEAFSKMFPDLLPTLEYIFLMVENNKYLPNALFTAIGVM